MNIETRRDVREAIDCATEHHGVVLIDNRLERDLYALWVMCNNRRLEAAVDMVERSTTADVFTACNVAEGIAGRLDVSLVDTPRRW